MKTFLKLVLIAIVLSFIGSLFNSNDEPPKTAEKEEVNAPGSQKTMAYIMSKEFVKSSLKAPSTAEFQKYHDGVSVVYSSSSEVYSVRMYVDAQNSFGAMIRNNFLIQVKPGTGDNWQLVHINKIN